MTVFIGEIEEKLKEEYPSEEVNMLAFTRQLLELELVEMVDGEEIACTKKKEIDCLAWVRPRVEQFFLNLNRKYRSKRPVVAFAFYKLCLKITANALAKAPSLFLIFKGAAEKKKRFSSIASRFVKFSIK